MEGIYIWLRHAPEDTGLPYFVFSKYQHLSVLPQFAVGDHIAAGKTIGLSGATGTAGKQYGPAGYPHLHLSTFYGPGGEYELKGMYGSMVSAKESWLGDPLILYLGDTGNLPSMTAVQKLPDERRTVQAAVVGDDGLIHPAGSKTVWPVACKKKGQH